MTMRSNASAEMIRARKRMSLSPQTLHVRLRLENWTKSGRKHWDLFRWIQNPFVLADALELVMKNHGVAGIDKETTESIRGKEYLFVRNLTKKIREGLYRPQAVRRVYIPKKDGRKRPLGIPTVEDRVVQRALVILMEPIYEKIFLPCSYGFRPGKRATDCAAELSKDIYKNRHVLEVDVEKFFDRISHKKLIGMLRETIVDPRVLKLIWQFLKSGYMEKDGQWQVTKEGTPQGGPISPLLANVYLHYSLDSKFAEASTRSKLYRFADDFVIISQTKMDLTIMKRYLNVWMREAKLKLNEKKTRTVDMRNKARSRESHFDFLGYRFHLRAFKDNPKRFWIARQPSQAARRNLRSKMKEVIHPHLKHGEVLSKVLLIWKGWTAYFRYGNSNRIFYRERRTIVRMLIHYFLRRKYRNQRKPVPWRSLRPQIRWFDSRIKPVRVIPDSIRQKHAQITLF